MAGFRIEGNTSGNVAEVAGSNQLKVIPETNASANPANIGGVRAFSENDQGLSTGTPYLLSNEIDDDYRSRVATDLVLDEENFSYTTQNTGKFTTNAAATTFVPSFTTSSYNTNPTNLTTANSACSLGTYAAFPIIGTSTLSADIEASFSATAVSNTTIDFGLFINAAATPFAPTDGAYFRFTSAGLMGVLNYNGTETTTSPFVWTAGGATWSPNPNQKYQFIVYVTPREVEFWLNDNGDVRLMGSLDTQLANGQPVASSALPFRVRHAIGASTASGALSFQLSRYSVRSGGPMVFTTFSTQGLRTYGSYQSMSGYGSTHAGQASYANSTNPTAAAPSNTALTANLPGGTTGIGLGGQGNVTAAAAAATDGIWSSFQVPAAAVGTPGRRLVLRGVKLDAINQGAAVATTATTVQFALAFGHTNVSLATTESAFAKAPRRVALGFMNWPIGAPIGAGPDKGAVVLDLGDAPIFVNPGEFVALVGKFVNGTATASQTILFTYTPIYGWE